MTTRNQRIGTVVALSNQGCNGPATCATHQELCTACDRQPGLFQQLVPRHTRTLRGIFQRTLPADVTSRTGCLYDPARLTLWATTIAIAMSRECDNETSKAVKPISAARAFARL